MMVSVMFDIKKLYSGRIANNTILRETNVRKKIENEVDGYKIIKLSNERLVMKDSNNSFKEVSREKTFSECFDFNKLCSAYLRVEQFVDIDYKSEIEICESLRELSTILSVGFIDKDDYIITTVPGNTNMGKLLGCKVYEYKLSKFNNYLIDLEEIDETILKKCKVLYMNYPNTPTGVVANKDFYKDVVKFAKKYNFIVVNDASTVDACYDSLDKISFLTIEGAKEVGIEFYDISKNSNEKECEGGFLAGNKEIVKLYKDIRENLYDRNLYYRKNAYHLILSDYEKSMEERKMICLRRHNLIKTTLEKMGFKTSIPKSGFYQYVEIPKRCNGVSFESAQEFASWLKENNGIIVNHYDSEGGYIGVSVNFEEGDEGEEDVVDEIEKRLGKYKFEFK